MAHYPVELPRRARIRQQPVDLGLPFQPDYAIDEPEPVMDQEALKAWADWERTNAAEMRRPIGRITPP